MIATRREFNDLIERACHTDCVGLDTEFIWERTYYPHLGLIQLALSDEDCHLIDPLAIEDLSPLGKLLEAPRVVKILHDAPQDLIILNRATGVIPRNVFDTRVAAGFAGLSSTISLADLVAVLLDIDLPKTETRTNWLKRPLDTSQVDYALDDVRYLRALRVLLLTRIILPELREALDQELEGLSAVRTYDPPDDQLRYLRIKGSGSLDRRGLAILKELAAWRESEARARNRPRGHILSDKLLLTIARQASVSIDLGSALELLSPKKISQHGEQIKKLMQKGSALRMQELPKIHPRIRLNAVQRSLHERLLKFLDKHHRVNGVDPHLVGNNTEFKQLVVHLDNRQTPLPDKFASGWRKDLLDQFFTQNCPP